jgi:acetyl-CoA carboxylase biotin carboxyl carrier protein
MADSRKQHATIEALVIDGNDSTRSIRAPKVGIFRPSIHIGALITPGMVVGTLEVLGVTISVLAPPRSSGIVREISGNRHARFAVGYADSLFAVDVNVNHTTDTARDTTAATSRTTDAHGVVFRAPTSGRFYLRAAPGKPPFVVVGDVISAGTALCLLEVMKTFHRVTYGGDGLPERAKIVAIVAAEESDINAGDVLLRLQPA